MKTQSGAPHRLWTTALLVAVSVGVLTQNLGGASGPQQVVTPQIAGLAVVAGWISWLMLRDVTEPPRAAIAAGSLSGALLLVVGSGLLFDVLTGFGWLPAEDGTPAAPALDWGAVATRLAATGAALAILARVRSAHRARRDRCDGCGRGLPSPTPRSTARAATWAVVASVPYLVLKSHWALGGVAGISDGKPLELDFVAGWGTVLLELIGAMGCVALVVLARTGGEVRLAPRRAQGKRVAPRLVLIPGWLGAAMLLTTGTPGMIQYVNELVTGTQGSEFALWVSPLVYGGWFVWGAVLAVALLRYYELTRPACQACR